MNVRRLVATAVISGVSVLALAPTMAHAETSGPEVKFWAEGHLKPGATIDLYAACGENKNGKPVEEAHVSAPYDIDVVLSPLADRGYLGGEYVVPANWTKSTMSFHLTCDNMATGDITIKAQVIKPRGPAQTGGDPARPTDLLPVGLATLTLAGAGAGAVVVRRARARA